MSINTDDTTSGVQARILCVDDEPGVRSALRRELQGYAVEQAESAAHARTLLERSAADVVICDMRMPGEDGISVTGRLRALAPEVAVVILTMVDDDATLADAVHHGAVGYVLKGADAGKWAITEVVEKGDGAWAKVSSLYTTLTFFQFTLSRAHSLSSRRAMLTFNLHRARRSSTPASEPAVPSPAWAGRASAETCCRRSGLLCTRFEDWG